MRRIALSVAVVWLCLALGSPSASGQTNNEPAALEGTLSDRSGAVIAGAQVTALSTATGQAWRTTTDRDGRFSLVDLPAATFEIHVKQDGFAEQARTITTTPGATTELTLTLSIAAVVEQINVTATPVNDGLDAVEIRESPARDLGEAAQDVAGVEKARQSAIASDIAIRGLLHNNVASTFDGARMYGACTGQMDPAAFHVDLSEVSHVDIVKGPFDVTSQGALGGLVKVITRTPRVHGADFTTNASTGSYGYYNPSEILQFGAGALHLLAGYSYRTSEMYRDGNGNIVSQLADYRNNSQFRQAFRVQSGWTRLAFEPSSTQRAEISYARQQGGLVLYPYRMMDGIFDRVDRFSARYDDLRPHGILNAAHGMVYVDKVNHLMDNRLRSSSGSLPVSMSAQVVSFTDGIRIDTDLAQGFTAGYEAYRRYWNSAGFMTMMMMGMPKTTPTNTLPGVTETLNGGFATWRRTIGKSFLLTAGGRYDYSHSDAAKASPALYRAFHGATRTTVNDSGVSGNVKLAWQSKSWASMFAGVGSNIRFPDTEEYFFRSDSAMGAAWVGNPLLTHPRNTEYDLGLTAKTSRLNLSPLFFFSNLDNYITLYAADRIPGSTGVAAKKAQSYANLQAHQWGGELTGSAPLPGGLELFGTFAYVRGTKAPQPANHIDSSNLFQVPPPTTTINLRYDRRALSLELSSIVTGRQDHVDTDENEQRTAGYSIFNLKGGYHLRRIGFTAGVNNLLSRQYSEFLSYARNPYSTGVRLPEPGRNFFINLSYSFVRGGE